MNIDEAIVHAESNSGNETECQCEHHQLAEWLRELKALREVRQERDEADDALRAVEAALNGIPYKGTYAQGVETLIKGLAFEHTERLELAAQNVALRSALHKLACLGNGDSFDNSVGNCIAQDALNLPNLAESILKRRDATVESKLLRGLVSGANGGKDGRITCKDLLDMVAEIEKETDR